MNNLHVFDSKRGLIMKNCRNMNLGYYEAQNTPYPFEVSGGENINVGMLNFYRRKKKMIR